MSDSGILLTIAIPTYNRKQLLLRTIKSVLAQMTDEVELLVSDNASDDGTDEAIYELKQQGHALTYIKNETNIGPDANFLQCFERAQGKFVLLLGSDDLLLPWAVEQVLPCLKQHPDLSLLYLNQAFFKGEYNGIASLLRQYKPTTDNKFNLTKRELMDYACERIGYMSSFILCRQDVLKVENKKRFIGTYFMQSCLALGATTAGGELGIVGKPVVAQDAIYRRSNATGCVIFGKYLKNFLCNIALEFGYDKKQMNRIYCNYACRVWPRMFARNKKEGVPVNKDFWRNGFGTVKMYPKAWVTIIPAVFVPAFVWKIIFKLCKKA